MTNCPNCGAPLKGNRCEYCGTRFDWRYEPHPQTPVINIIQNDRPCDILTARITVPEVERTDVKSILADKLAEILTDYMDLKTEYDPLLMEYTVASRIRIVKPGYKFY